MAAQDGRLSGVIRRAGCVSLGTKAESLERMAPLLTSAVCLPQISFTVEDWEHDRHGITRSVCSALGTEALAVRSSALTEDTETNSNAGAFCSMLGVAPYPREIEYAIRRVIASYDKADPRNQVLIQPQLRDVALSGVVFTRDLQHGAPYFAINVESSGRTDGITGGTARSGMTYYLRRGARAPHMPTFAARIVEMACEIEALTGLDALDIEFAIDSAGILYLLQVRPIASLQSRLPRSADESLIEEARDSVASCAGRVPGLAGQRTMLSDMSDWNPAELIGSHPNPLACSLFKLLVTDSAWREGRGQLGYFDPAGKSLLVVLAGRPYIDMRSSFNSLLPACVPLKLREAIVEEAMDYLQTNPHLHDKIEFEVLTTCYTPSFDLRETRYRRAGLTSHEITDFKSMIRDHTETLIRGEFRSLPSLMSELAEMDAARARVLELDWCGDALWRVRYLLSDCRQRGLTSFAAVARLAFVGSAMLRSFVEVGAIETRRAEAFFRSIGTVAGEMTAALAAIQRRELPLGEFLHEYGHLRPGTFDITSPRYDEDPGAYFINVGGGPGSALERVAKASFRWTSEELAAMAGALGASGLGINVRDVLAFVRAGVVAREKAKFLFTKNLSDALRMLTEWGRQRNLDRETLSYLRIDQLLALGGQDHAGIANAAETLAAEATAVRARECQLILPELIAAPDDLDHVRFISSRPTFVTDCHIIGPVQFLSPRDAGVGIRGRIVLIESADPGYDWILGYDIRGLITKYGGTASHMAIRCTEFGLPAAIGVGSTFETLRGARAVELDCMNHRVRLAS